MSKMGFILLIPSEHAMGANSMLQKRNVNTVEGILRAQAKHCGVKIYHLVNVGNHIHLVIKITNRLLYKRYIRSITGLIARHVLNKQRGLAGSQSTKTKRFWISRPFTRLINWGKDFKRITQYMNKNHRQGIFIAWGFETTNLEDIYLLNTG